MTDSESENSFRWHKPKTLGADFPCQQFTMLVERKSLRNLYSRPEFVVRSGTDSIRGTEHDMARKRIVPKHPLERGLNVSFGNFPRHQRALGKIGRQQSLPHAADRARSQHGSNACHHILDTDPRAIGNLLERLANE